MQLWRVVSGTRRIVGELLTWNFKCKRVVGNFDSCHGKNRMDGLEGFHLWHFCNTKVSSESEHHKVVSIFGTKKSAGFSDAIKSLKFLLHVSAKSQLRDCVWREELEENMHCTHTWLVKDNYCNEDTLLLVESPFVSNSATASWQEYTFPSARWRSSWSSYMLRVFAFKLYTFAQAHR